MSREERLENLLDHAAAHVLEEGWESLNMEGLAARAGVSKSLPYKHFANRNDALLALWQRESSAMDLRFARAFDGIEGLEDRIRVAADIWFDEIEAGGSLHVLDRAGVGCADLQKLRNERVARYQDAWAERGRSASDLDEDEAAVVAAILIGGLVNIGSQWPARRERREVIIETVVAATLACFENVHRYRKRN
jgi:AcrR family transcriptional regulator